MSALCQCGCGLLAPIAKQSSTRRGHTKGQPIRFCAGHNDWRTRTPSMRFDAKCSDPDENGCIKWMGRTNPRYGSFYADGRNQYVHRFAWERVNGPIPNGLVIDHLCKNTICVNPAHLEAVTQRENLMRSDSISRINSEKTECIHGHAYTEENTYRRPRGTRECRTCVRIRFGRVAA